MKAPTKRKLLKAAIILAVIAAALIYLLFFAYFPPFGVGSPNTTEMTKRAAVRECPEIEVTDYDREFLDKILSDPRFEELENSEGYASMSVTADEAGYERYALRPDENYTVYADYNMYGMAPLYVSIQFEYEGGLYREDLFLSANKTRYGVEYSKAVTTKRSDGKLIKRYWNFNGNYNKETWTYGIVSYIKVILSAIYGR